MSVVTFIINPTSGTGKSKAIPGLIRSYFPKTGNTYKIRLTEYAGHAKAIVNEEIANGSRIIVAVGGDGTVNEVASGLLFSNAALGIVPTGSGNGLARHLKIPMNAKKALRTIAEGFTATIDSGEVNGHAFFCTAGIGFDAVVAERFSSIKGRGLWNYIKASMSEYQRYVPEQVKDQYGNSYSGFLLSICNANQYGNNFFVCPTAKIDDGQLNLVHISPLSLWKLPALLIQLLNKTVHDNKAYGNTTFSTLTLKKNQAGPLHVDGDPVSHTSEISIRCVAKSLNVIVPSL